MPKSTPRFCNVPLHYSNILRRNAAPTFPAAIADWKVDQEAEPTFIADIPPESLLLCVSLTLYRDPELSSRILVPPTLREAITCLHHADLQHVSHNPKVLTSIVRHYFWPQMKADFRRWVKDCELCENERGK